MAKRIFIIVIVLSFVIYFLPTSVKLQITKYPRIIFLFPLDGIDKLLNIVQSREKEYQALANLATKLTLENALLQEQIQKEKFTSDLSSSNFIQADIIGRDNETGVRFLTIDKSVHDNIKINMPCFTAHGIIGKIIESTDNQSIIETALSPSLKISAIDQRSRVAGVIEYSTFSKLRFKYAFAESDIQTNDTIITSGLGGIFPRGLIIGTVLNHETDPTRFFQYVEVKPTVNFNTLENVFVLISEVAPPEEPRPKYSRPKNQYDLEDLKIEIPITPRIR